MCCTMWALSKPVRRPVQRGGDRDAQAREAAQEGSKLRAQRSVPAACADIGASLPCKSVLLP